MGANNQNFTNTVHQNNSRTQSIPSYYFNLSTNFENNSYNSNNYGSNQIPSFDVNVNYDTLTGSPEVSLDFAMPKEYEKTIQQIFSFLNSQPVKTVIAIDEFQQITTYPEKNTEAVLRTHIQHLKNCSFIFCGSNHRIMTEIFNNAKRPFYGSCRNIALDFISEDE